MFYGNSPILLSQLLLRLTICTKQPTEERMRHLLIETRSLELCLTLLNGLDTSTGCSISTLCCPGGRGQKLTQAYLWLTAFSSWRISLLRTALARILCRLALLAMQQPRTRARVVYAAEEALNQTERDVCTYLTRLTSRSCRVCRISRSLRYLLVPSQSTVSWV